MAKKGAKAYRHDQQALLRPEAGGRTAEHGEEAAREYRYDSSLAPELRWDESTISAQVDAELQNIQDANTLEEAKASVQRLRNMSKPFLNWAGKAERAAFTVPTLPLFVHERLSTSAVLDTLERHKRDRTGTLNLFGEGAKSVKDKISGAYKHTNGWQNRLILGDSLQVMNSLLYFEKLGGGGANVLFRPSIWN